MSKAAQGFSLRRTDRTPQTETRGERRSSEKGPFMDGNQLSRDEGFTLIEILVAMAILGICLVTIMQLFSGGLKSSKVSDEYTRAIFHAREKMEEMLLAKELTEEALAGDFGDGFEWNAEISRVQLSEEEDAKIPVNTYTVKVQVQWSEGRHRKNFEISTLRTMKKG